MKARWLVVAALLLGVLGFVLPYILTYITAQNAEGWEGVWEIIIASSLYSYVAYVLWALAVILFIAAIVVYAKGKRRRK